MSYTNSLPASFQLPQNYNFAATYNSDFNGQFGVDTAGAFNRTALNLTGTGALASSPGWTFITAPESVSWDVANQATRVDIFGTNNPPVVAGSRGMRDLTLSNALVEGFVRGVTVEGKISALENLLNYKLNASDGFVSVPVYQVWASEKSYGGSEAYYIIRDVKVKEAMRDLKGNATRAYVDISLMQVPAYQVNSGRDQARFSLTGARSALIDSVRAQANQNMTGAASKGGTNSNNPNAKPNSGPGTGTNTNQGQNGQQRIRGARADQAIGLN